MTKAERIMASLKDSHTTEKPQWDTRQRLALALMRVDKHISCRNCTRRHNPCMIYEQCRVEGFAYFLPKSSLMKMEMERVNAIIDEIDTL